MHRGEAGEGEVGEEAGQCHLTGCQSPGAALFPGPVGDEPGRTREGAEPPEGGQGGAPLGQSGGEPGPAGWLGAAAGWGVEE